MNTLDSMRIDGRRALVTGGSRGLGLEIARALVDGGASVTLVGREAERLESAREELSAAGGVVDTITADIGLPAEAERLCEEALSRFAPIDILVNNVGGRRINYPTEEMPLTEWQRIIDLNLTQAFILTKTIGGAMLPRKRGRVINVASISAFLAGKPMRGRSYETSKAALTMFTRAVAADWAPHGVTVNAVAPGGFMTDANRRWFRENPQLQQVFEAQVPMGRLGEPDELGPLAVYLASGASSYMTGTVLTIDGGYTVW